MRLDLSDILREAGRRVEYNLNEPSLVDEHVECTRPIVGRLEFANTGGTLSVRGAAETCVALACSKCAIYFEHTVALNIDEQFELRHVSAGPHSLRTVTIVEEDVSPIAGKLFDGHVFDLTEMLRQYILLDEPAKPEPPVLPNGVCAVCARQPESIIVAATGDSASRELEINPAFAALEKLLDENPQ